MACVAYGLIALSLFALFAPRITQHRFAYGVRGILAWRARNNDNQRVKRRVNGAALGGIIGGSATRRLRTAARRATRIWRPRS
jgi:hypothetical protein